MNEQKELISRYSNKQDKFVYYIIALCVAALGFAIHRTTETTLSCFHIPLGISVLSWSVSVYFGFNFIKRDLDYIFTNNSLIEIQEGRDKIAGNHPEKIDIGQTVLREILDEKAEKMSKVFLKQEITFFFGVFSFIVWHILMMYLNTSIT